LSLPGLFFSPIWIRATSFVFGFQAESFERASAAARRSGSSCAFVEIAAQTHARIAAVIGQLVPRFIPFFVILR
jgi:hypothetical protein